VAQLARGARDAPLGLVAASHPAPTSPSSPTGTSPRGAIDERATELEQRRYDRIAPLYDAMERPLELRAGRWRRELWGRVGTGRILELGVGTGKNLPYYPPGGDAQALAFPAASFDVVVATLVFCSVPDPVLGLAEARRVLVPGGRLLLVEHVLSRRPALRRVMRWIDPITSRIWGAQIARDTVDNVRRAGFRDVVETDLWLDVVKRSEAVAP
jgi:hypothetical protein